MSTTQNVKLHKNTCAC